MAEQNYVYVDANYLKELEETAKKVDYYKGIIDGINMVIDRKTENSSEKPNNCEVKNYCDDCLYTDTCDSKEFFYACTSKATISKMEQVDEPQTEDGIMPEVKAEVRFDENNKTLWIKTDTVENYDRVIIEDGSNWCRIFYEECGECAHNTPRSNDEPQTDCSWK